MVEALAPKELNLLTRSQLSLHCIEKIGNNICADTGSYRPVLAGFWVLKSFLRPYM